MKSTLLYIDISSWKLQPPPCAVLMLDTVLKRVRLSSVILHGPTVVTCACPDCDLLVQVSEQLPGLRHWREVLGKQTSYKSVPQISGRQILVRINVSSKNGSKLIAETPQIAAAPLKKKKMEKLPGPAAIAKVAQVISLRLPRLWFCNSTTKALSGIYPMALGTTMVFRSTTLRIDTNRNVC